MRAMYRGDLTLDRDGDWSGMVAGDLIVRAGAQVRVSGMVAGNVIVEQGAEARIAGMVGGRVIDHGGGAIVTGMVAGR